MFSVCDIDDDCKGMSNGHRIPELAGVQEELPAGVSVLRGVSRSLRHARSGDGSSGFRKDGSRTRHETGTRLHDGRLPFVEKEK